MATVQTRIDQQRRMLEEATASVWSDTTLLEWNDQASQDLAYRLGYQKKETRYSIVAGTRYYARPTNDVRPLKVYYNDYYTLPRQEHLVGSTTASGTPHGYSLTTASICLTPIPNVTASLRYISEVAPATLVAATNTLNLPNHAFRAMDAYVCMQAMKQIGDTQMAQVYSDDYERFAGESMKRASAERQTDADNSPVDVYG